MRLTLFVCYRHQPGGVFDTDTRFSPGANHDIITAQLTTKRAGGKPLLAAVYGGELNGAYTRRHTSQHLSISPLRRALMSCMEPRTYVTYTLAYRWGGGDLDTAPGAGDGQSCHHRSSFPMVILGNTSI